MVYDRYDYVALGWVKDEIIESIKQARLALESYIKNQSDISRMHFSIFEIHQVQGVLKVVKFNSLAHLAMEIEKLARDILLSNVDKNAGFDLIMCSLLQFPVFIEHSTSSHQEIHTAIIKIINELRVFTGQEKIQSNYISPRSDSYNDNYMLLSNSELTKLNTQELHIELNKMYQSMQACLLSLLGEQKIDLSISIIHGVMSRLIEIAPHAPITRLWNASNNLISYLLTGKAKYNNSIHSMLNIILQELKNLSEIGVEYFNKIPNDEYIEQFLIYNNKHYSASNSTIAPDNKAVRILDHATINSVGVALRQELAKVKDVIESFARTDRSNKSALSNLLPVIHQVANTFEILKLTHLKQIVTDQASAIDLLIKGAREADDVFLMNIAGSLLYLESTITGMMALKEKDDTHDSPVMTVTQMHFNLVREAVVNLHQVKDMMAEFISTDWRHSVLEPVPMLIHNASGALHFINEDKAADILQSAQHYIQEQLLDNKIIPKWEHLDILADSISSIEYYLERLSEEIPQSDNILNTAVDGLASLDYAVINTKWFHMQIKQEQAEINNIVKTEPKIIEAGFNQYIQANIASLAKDKSQDKDDNMGILINSELLSVTDNTSASTSNANLTSSAIADQTDLDTNRFITKIIFKTEIPKLLPPDADEELIDDELLEIFTEEANEVLEAIAENLPIWELHNEESPGALVEVRRAFHTLKGSGRMVRALVIGELAWSIESMLNRVIDKTIVDSEDVHKVVKDVVDLVPSLITEYENRKQVHHEQVDILAATAHALSRGEALEYETVATSSSNMSTATSDTDTNVNIKSIDVDPVKLNEELATNATNIIFKTEIPKLLPPDADEELIDDELLEIFTEEANEVLEAIAENLPIWELHNEESPGALVEVRRAFHTLKGSGRMVRALVIGELAWSIESMLNRVIDKTIVDSEDVHKVVKDVVDLVPSLITEYENRKQVHHEQVDILAATAHALSRGEALEYETVATSSSNMSTATSDTDTNVNIKSIDVDPVKLNEELATNATDTEELTINALNISNSSKRIALDTDEQLVYIFIQEAEMHLEALLRFISTTSHVLPQPVTDEVQRALHTLKGSAYMANIIPIAEISAPVESMLKDFKVNDLQIGFSESQILSSAHELLSQAINQLKSGVEISLPSKNQFILEVSQVHNARLAQLDIILRQKNSLLDDEQASKNFFRSKEIQVELEKCMDAVFDGELIVNKWHKQPELLKNLPDIATGLHALSAVATQINLPSMCIISNSLAQMYDAIVVNFLTVDNEFLDTAIEAHASLIDMMDQLAAGLQVTEHTDIAQRLEHIKNTHIINMNESSDENLNIDTFDIDDIDLSDINIELNNLDPILLDDDIVLEDDFKDLNIDTFDIDESNAVDIKEDNAISIQQSEEQRLLQAQEQAQKLIEKKLAEAGFDNIETKLNSISVDISQTDDAEEDILDTNVNIDTDIDIKNNQATDKDVAEFDDLSDLEDQIMPLSVNKDIEDQNKNISKEDLVGLVQDTDLDFLDMELTDLVDTNNGIVKDDNKELLLDDVDFEIDELEIDMDIKKDTNYMETASPVTGNSNNFPENNDDKIKQAQMQAAKLIADKLAAAGFSDNSNTDSFTVGSVDAMDAQVNVAEDNIDVTIVSTLDEKSAEDINSDINTVAVSTAADNIDEEILDIFLEEAPDIMDAANMSLSNWFAAPEDTANIVLLQRYLHTIKGGARMVGVNSLGDLTHELETLYEVFVEGKLQYNTDLNKLIQLAHDNISESLDALQERKPLPNLAGLTRSISAFIQTGRVEPIAGDNINITQEEPNAVSEKAASQQQTTPTDASEVFDFSAIEDEPADIIDQEILEIFLEEAPDVIDAANQSLGEFLKEPTEVSRIAVLQRHLHTLKGGARMAGVTSLGNISHALETLYEGLVEGRFQFDDSLSPFLQHAHDAVVEMIDALLFRKPLPRLAPVTRALEHYTENGSIPEYASNLNTSTQQQAPSTQQDVQSTEQVQIYKQVTAEDLPFMRAAKKRTDDAQRQVNTQEQIRVSADIVDNLVDLAGETSIFRGRVEQQVTDLTVALSEMENTIERAREQLRRLDTETQAQIASRVAEIEAEGYEGFDPLEMDRHSQLQQLSRALFESASDLFDVKETLSARLRDTQTLLLQQARVNTELQESLMRTRLVPFDRQLPRLRRIVRQVAGELKKQVNFVVENAEGEMDRTVLERLIAPMEHMLRNAVDHGIEPIDVRRQKGKPDIGTIKLNLGRDGGDIVLTLSDDGGGIRTDKVKAKAIERGILAPDAEISDHEVRQLVLEAGLSTAEQITQISGRGVGMDVAISEIRQLGGSIVVYSEEGSGAQFVVRMPFTVSITRALMVEFNEQLYAVSLNTIEGVVRMMPQDVVHYYQEGAEKFEYGGFDYDIRYLGEFLNNGQLPKINVNSRQQIQMLLLRSSDHAVAMQVDHIVGVQEIVVKSLGGQFATIPGVSGATILGDGRIVVILDMLAMVRTYEQTVFSQRIRASEELSTSIAEEEKAVDKPILVMIVDDSVTVRKVTTRLLERYGINAVAAKDGRDAIDQLNDGIKPDVMLLDIEMPRMDGFEVATRVRHSSETRDLPIIMITSRSGDKHRDRAMSIGVNEYMSKPYQEDTLLANIQKLTGKYIHV